MAEYYLQHLTDTWPANAAVVDTASRQFKLTSISDAVAIRADKDFIGVLLYELQSNTIETDFRWVLSLVPKDHRVPASPNGMKAVPCFKGTGPDYTRISSAGLWKGADVLNYWQDYKTGVTTKPPGKVIQWCGGSYVVTNMSLRWDPEKPVVFDMARGIASSAVTSGWLPWENANWHMDKYAKKFFGRPTHTYPRYKKGNVYKLDLTPDDGWPKRPREGAWKFYEGDGGILMFGKILYLTGLSRVFYTDDQHVLAAMKHFYPSERITVVTGAECETTEVKEQLGHPCVIEFPDSIGADARFRVDALCDNPQTDLRLYRLYLGNKLLMRTNKQRTKVPSHLWLSLLAGNECSVNLSDDEMALCSDLIVHRFGEVEFGEASNETV